MQVRHRKDDVSAYLRIPKLKGMRNSIKGGIVEIDKKAFHQLTYGLFLLSTKCDGKDNGCIVNTVVQVASNPHMLSVACSKENFTQGMIQESGLFNVSVLDESTEMSFFERFGMASGRDTQKFTEDELKYRRDNGIVYYAKANAVFGCKVSQCVDLESHSLFIGEVCDSEKLSDAPSITYSKYLDAKRASKTESKPTEEEKPVAWRCLVCGYIYEEAELPSDFICPVCKHGAEDFVPIFAEDGE